MCACTGVGPLYTRYTLLEIGITGRGFCLVLTPHRHPLHSNSRQDEKLRYRGGSRPLIPFSASSWPIRGQRGGLGIRCESTWDSKKEEPPSSEEGNINGKSEIQLNQIKMIVLDIPGYAVRTHHTAKLMGRYQFQTNKRFSITIPNIWMHSLFIMTRSIVQNSD